MARTKEITIKILSIIALVGILSAGAIIQLAYAHDGYIMNLVLGALHDVILDNPVAGQVLTYNGTYWVNGAGSSGGNGTVNSVNAGAGILVNQTTGNVLVTNDMACDTLGTGIPICNGSDGANMYFRGLNAGDGITLTTFGSEQDILINATAQEIFFINGTAISVTNNGTHYTITNLGVTSITTDFPLEASDATGTVNLTCPSCQSMENYINGSGISITNNITHTTITNTGVLSVTSDNSAITVSPTTGDAVLSPKWKLLAQATLGASGTSINSGAFTAHEHLMINVDIMTITNTLVSGIRFNGDTGNSYSWRSSLNGGADTTGTNDTECQPIGANSINTGAVNSFTFFVSNIDATDRKIAYGTNSGDSATGDGSAPSRGEFACKWDNTVNNITSVQLIRESGTGSFATGSEITVWGYQ